jgi:hypothetical protein
MLDIRSRGVAKLTRYERTVGIPWRGALKRMVTDVAQSSLEIRGERRIRRIHGA